MLKFYERPHLFSMNLGSCVQLISYLATKLFVSKLMAHITGASFLRDYFNI